MSLDRLSEENIFEQAFELQSPQVREDFLKLVCRDEQQRARIQALLREGAPEASFLEKGPTVLQESNNRTSDFPKRIGDFEILAELGRGGMGVVYRARQCSLNRLVALKLLSTGLGLTTKAIMRFKLEAEAAAKLHHTNIVPIYWTGEENRVPYYAMELIDGPSLDQVIKQLRQDADSATDSKPGGAEKPPIPNWLKETIIHSPSSANDTAAETNDSSFDSSSSLGSDGTYYDNLAKMIAGVADALAHAHDHGIVHRDIKPANLLLSSDGRLSINDFGLARMLEQPGMTMTGELMGSPMYMSPEQITAGRLPLDHRTDIYSIGATLYELLTLQPPFAGQQRDQVLSQVIHKDPPTPRSINPRIPRDLETICMKAMEKDPDRRYQTAGLLAEDLQRFVNRHAISARRVGPLERASRWARKNKALTAMACLTLVVGMVAGLFAYRDRAKRLEVQAKQLEEAKGFALLAAFGPDSTEALKKIERARTLGAQPAWVRMLTGQVDLLEGRSQEAIVNLKLATDDQENSVMAQSMLTAGYLANGDFGAYANTLERLDSMSPKSAEDHLFKGWAIRILTPDQAMEEMNQAFKTPRTFTLAHVLRAHTRTIQAQHQNNLALVESAISELDTVSLDLEESALLSNYYLFALLTGHKIRLREGNRTQAMVYLASAHEHVIQLAEFPSYLYGNKNRLVYFALNEKFHEMQKVMDDVVSYGNSGFIVQPYAAAFYQVGGSRSQDALNQLKEMDQGNPNVAVATCILRMDIPEEREDARETFRNLVESIPNKSSSTVDGLRFLMLGEAAAKSPSTGLKHYDTDISEYLSDDIDEEELLDRVGNSEFRRQMAHFSIGARKLAMGYRYREQAKESFKKSAESPLFNWGTCMWSQAFVARMEQDDNWPEWLPVQPVSVEAR